MQEPVESIVEEREEVMISCTGEGNPVRRTAHFLKPLNSSIERPVFELPWQSLPSSKATNKTKTWPLRGKFVGWSHPQSGWNGWVARMVSLHLSTWKKAGIHEAIMNSTFRIPRNDLLILGLAEKWCDETNSFVFPWGEATITLEDVMVSWGYSVLGSSVNSPLQRRELKEIKLKLENARKEILRTAAKKASHSLWMKKFMDSGVEFEHEAFLACWLSRFVFPICHDVISDCVFPIAIQLARGTKIALAPAVLANLYRDLGVLKHKISTSTKLENNEDEDNVEAVRLTAPFPLLQIWACERFLKLQPQRPNSIKIGESRLAWWHDLKLKVEDVRLVLDSASQDFHWRPYTKFEKSLNFPKFYGENGQWVLLDSGLDEELESFVECLRVSKIVGLGYEEWYFPNRVAMQFGMDQDIPIMQNADSRLRPFNKVKAYVPPSSFLGSVTTRYLKWWKQSMNCLRGATEQVCSSSEHFQLPLHPYSTLKSIKASASNMMEKGQNARASNGVLTKKSREGLKRKKEHIVSKGSLKRKENESASSGSPWRSSNKLPKSFVTPGFPLKLNEDEASDPMKEDELTIAETFKLSGREYNFENGQKLPPRFVVQKEIDSSPNPPGFPSKLNTVEANDPMKKDELTIAEMFEFSDKQVDVKNSQDGNGVKSEVRSQRLPSVNADTKLGAIDPVVEDKMKTAELFKFGNKNDYNGEGHDDGECLSAKGSARDMEQVTETSENIMHDVIGLEVSDDEIEAVKDGSMKNMEQVTAASEKIMRNVVVIELSDSEDEAAKDANNCKSGSSVGKTNSIEDNDGGGRSFTFDLPGLDLEPRIRSLERIFFQLKATRLARHSRSRH